MSQQHNHWLSQWEVVSDHLRCTSFRRDSLVLSERDNATWAEALLTGYAPSGPRPLDNGRLPPCKVMVLLSSISRLHGVLSRYEGV